MKPITNIVAVAGLLLATQAMAQVSFYEHEDFEGRSFVARGQVDNFAQYGFNDRASSVVVTRDRWEVCSDAGFGGRCVVLREGRYPSLSTMGLNDRISSVRMVDANTRLDDNRYAPTPTAGQITFYEHDGFRGRSFTTGTQIANFDRRGFNARASSVVILRDRWEVCEDIRFSGRCVVLRPGRYESLAAMGLNDRVSSVRAVAWNARVEESRYAPAPVTVYDNRRRNNERIYEANVTSVRAVVGPPTQRCWIDREQVAPEGGAANVPGAIVGAIIGGVLGHQIGGGRGQDLATAGGAVAGGAVGANVGRFGGGTQTRDVERCASVPSQARPEFWDITYTFRGQEHRMQVTSPPGPTIFVNERGEPRA